MTGSSMTKAALVEEVSRAADLPRKQAEKVVETVLDSIVDALHGGDKVELRGFGSFRLRRRNSRKGRNPQTGAPVDVPAKRVPYFKPGKELRALINEYFELPPRTPSSSHPSESSQAATSGSPGATP